jgi:hypothetical protein
MRVLPYFAAAVTFTMMLGCDDHTDASPSTMPVADNVAGDQLTTQPAQARPLIADAKLTPILTVGDPLPGQEDNPDPEQRVWAPIPDGLGAFQENSDLVLFANHEITSSGVDGKFPYARVSRLVLDPKTLKVKSGSYPLTGKPAGLLFQRLCSASFFGPDEGFADGWFFTGEESVTGGAEGIQLAVRRDGSHTRRLPWLGRFAHENYISIPGIHGKVVLLGTDDSSPASLGGPGQSELYMYVAPKASDVLFGHGKLYVFESSEKAQSGELKVGQPIHGRFEEITHAEDLSPTDLQAKVDRHGAFKFVRLEDIDYDRRPSVGTGNRSGDPLVYFVDTGNLNAQCGGTTCDLFGSIYSLRLDPDDPTRNARLELLARSEGAETGWASPDNIAVSQRSLMVQEDPAYAGFNRPERIWNFRLRANGGLDAPKAVVELETQKFTGNVCSEPAGTCWESSGIIDASRWLGDGAWLFDVQAHTLPFSYKDKQATVNLTREGGQLLYLRLRGS